MTNAASNQQLEPQCCDYRNESCATIGITIQGKRWVCRNHYHFLIDSRVSDGGVVTTVDDVRRLTKPELNHLIYLLEAERESGEYAGPREQYYVRTERLIKWCNEQIGAKQDGNDS